MTSLKTPMLLLLMGLIGSTFSTSRATDAHPRESRLDWSWGPSLPRVTAGAACCATPQGVVSIGGAYWEGLDTGNAQKVWLRDVYQLNPPSARWAAGPAFPTAVSHALAVVVDDELFVIGGRDEAKAHDQTWRLKLGDSTAGWQPAAALPRPAFGLGGGVVDSTIYVVTDAFATVDGAVDAAHPPAILAWDTTDTEGGWRQVALIPEADIGFRTVAVVGRKLVLLGGAAPSDDVLRLVDAIEVFDLDTLEWRDGPRLPVPIRDASAVAIDAHRLMLIGGVENAAAQTQDAETPAVVLTNRCWIYDIEANQLGAAGFLRLAVADHGLAATTDRLYVVAGEDSPYRTRTAQVQVAAFEVRHSAEIRTREGRLAPSPLVKYP